MLIQIVISALALAAVVYSLAGEPRKQGKLTVAGKGILIVGTIAFALNIIKSYNDSKTSNNREETLRILRDDLKQSKANTDKIPSLQSHVKTLKDEGENLRISTVEAVAETAKLRSAIIAIFASVKVENNRLIATTPNSIIVKDRGPLGHFSSRKVHVNKEPLIKEINKFQNDMENLEKELLEKVKSIENLFLKISEETSH